MISFEMTTKGRCSRKDCRLWAVVTVRKQTDRSDRAYRACADHAHSDFGHFISEATE